MNQETIDKIDKLLEENKEVAGIVSEVRPADLIPFNIGDTYSGFRVGEKLGHPLTGATFGAEAVAGVKSNTDPTISISDMYTPTNTLKRLFQHGVVGAALGGAADGLHGAMLGGLGGAALGSIAPAGRYTLGKTFGGQLGSLNKNIQKQHKNIQKGFK